jgi:putative PEP-CTERM system TPR-repeat lipoprotein
MKTSAIVLALILGACSETKTVEQLIVNGNEFVAVRDFSSAVIEFKNAVRLEPKNANARFVLGNAYLEQGNYLNAEKELSRALELGLDFSSVAALMARVKTGLNKADEVYPLVERSNGLADDDYIQVLTYAGISAFKQNKVAQGEDFLTQAIAINEEAIYSQIAKAYLHYEKQEFSQGVLVVKSLLAQHKQASEALLIQGHLYNALQDFEHASDTFALYLTYHPQDHRVRFFEVNNLIKAEKFEQANVLTDALLKVFKDSPLALQYKAQLEYQNKNYKEARNYANQAMQYGEGSTIARLISGVSSYQLGDIEQAYTHLNAIDEYLVSTHPVKKLLAVTKFKLGYYAETAESLFELEKLTVNDANLLTMTTANLISIGELDSALALIEKSKKTPRTNNDSATDINTVQQSSEFVDNQLALAIEYLKKDQNAKAQQIADELKETADSKYLGLLLQGIIYVKQEDDIKAAKSFEEVLLLKPENVASLFNLALLKQKNTQYEAALAFYQRILAVSSEHQGTLRQLITLADNNDMAKRVLALLSEHEYRDSLILTIALAQSLRTNNKVTEAITVLEEISTEEKLTSSYYMVLGDSYLQQQNVKKASAAFVQGLALAPQSLPLNIRYIGTLNSLLEYPKALVQARKAYVYHEDSERIAVLLTYLEAKNNNLTQAKTMLAKLRSKQVTHHLLDTVTGEIALYEQKNLAAVDAFSAAYEVKANQMNLISLARALKISGQANEAEKLLETFIEQHPENEQVRVLLVSLYGVENRDKKIIQYLSLSKSSPDNALVFNNLAWNQYKIGQVKAALENIETAQKLKGDSLAIQESYGVILVANNALVKGISVLEAAVNKGSESAEVKASLAKAIALIEQEKSSNN